MHRIELTVAPGIWRSPEWILDEFERIATKHRCATLVDAIQLVCQQQKWHFAAYERTVFGARVLVTPLRPRPRVYEGHVDVTIPVDLADATRPNPATAAPVVA